MMVTHLRMVTHQEEVYNKLGISALRLNSKNYDQVTTARDGHLSFLGWSPTNLRMVTHQLKDGHPPEGRMLQNRNLALKLNSQD